jgi:hypothetical protein
VSLDWIIFGLRLLSTAILYSFLGVAFLIVWRDLKATERVAAAKDQPLNFCLRVVAAAGKDSPAVGDLLALQPVTGLGCDPDSTIVLTDESASGQHARIYRQNGVWWLEDLGSHAGTTLNDRPVSQPATLSESDLIGIGQLRFRVELS